MTPCDKRQQITAAIERLLNSSQPQQITTDAIAAEARVGKGTIYRYFRDKEDLFLHAAMRGFDELVRLVETGVEPDRPFVDQLRRAAERISGFFTRRCELTRIMQSEDCHTPGRSADYCRQWQAKQQSLDDAIATIMQRGIDQGELRTDAQPALLARLFLGLLRTRHRDLADLPESQRSLDLIVELFLTGAGGGAPLQPYHPEAVFQSEASPAIGDPK
jgi:AcrR family transcriptional regulator